MPALDGLRGLAVIGVLLFHADLSWAKGGFLGVSTFFTLSGFLITALLVTERSATGGVAMSGFWARRARRLMPAAFAAIALAVVVTALVGDTSQVENLRGEVAATLTYTANWHFVLAEQSYAELFSSPSMLLHFWSLAIEEQFYVLFPLLLVGVLAATGPLRRTRAIAVLAALTVISVGLAVVPGWSLDRVYFGTDTRAAELLAGALLALVLFDRDVTARLREPTAKRIVGTVGTVALVLCLAAWGLVSRSAGFVGRGGLALYALATVAVLMAAIVPGTPVNRALGWKPLRVVGLVSYGLYLFHWPLYRYVDQSTSLSGLPFLVVALGATAALTAASYRWLEQPIRRGARPRGHNPVLLAVPAVVLLAGLTVAVSANPPPPVIDFDTAASMDLAPAPAPTTAPAVGGDQAAPAIPDPYFAFFGDSTAMMTQFGVNDYGVASGILGLTGGETEMGCGIGRGGDRRQAPGGAIVGPVPPECNDWAVTWAEALTANRPNAVVVQTGPWDVIDRRLEGTSGWTHLGDPAYDEYLLGELLAATDLLSSQGAVVIWISPPPIGRGENDEDPVAAKGAEGEEARWVRLAELIDEVATQRPDSVEVVDLGAWIESTGEDARLRPDGIHFSVETAYEVAERFLADALVAAYESHLTGA